MPAAPVKLPRGGLLRSASVRFWMLRTPVRNWKSLNRTDGRIDLQDIQGLLASAATATSNHYGGDEAR